MLGDLLRPINSCLLLNSLRTKRSGTRKKTTGKTKPRSSWHGSMRNPERMRSPSMTVEERRPFNGVTIAEYEATNKGLVPTINVAPIPVSHNCSSEKQTNLSSFWNCFMLTAGASEQTLAVLAQSTFNKWPNKHCISTRIVRDLGRHWLHVWPYFFS